MSTRLMLAGNASWLNRGCEAIEKSVRSIMDSEIGDLSYLVLPFGEGDGREVDDSRSTRLTPPDWSVTPWSMERVFRSSSKRIGVPQPHRAFMGAFAPYAQALSMADALIQIGGDNFTLDYGKPDRFWALNEAARAVRRPVVLLGASIGPFADDERYERYAAKMLRSADLVIARERVTVEYLDSIGVRENVSFAMDPAFALEPVEPTDASLLEMAVGAVALNVSPLFGRFAGMTSRSLGSEVASIVREVAKRFGCRVLLVPHVLLPGQDDHWFLSEVAASVTAASGTVSVLPRELGAAEIKAVVSRCRAVIAARTHLTIAGFSMGVPTVSLGYSAKARGINLAVYGHDEFVIDAAHMSAAAVMNRLENVLSDESDIRARLGDRQGEFKASALSAGTLVSDLLVSTSGARE